MGNVSLRGVEKAYGETRVIQGVDLEVADGEFVVFVGPSGCGKSSMLRMIAGLEEITGGELRIGNQIANDLPPFERGAAMVFQNYALYPHMTVAENMGFALRMAGMPAREINLAVRRAADILRIEPLLARKPKALSGGERQRVAIGRAIVRKPKVFLFDEPLSNLDASLRVQMRLELSRLHRELGSTMIYVTHDQVEAMTMGDRIVVFNQGRIEQVGTPLQLYHRPANEFVAGFLGSPRMNFLPCSGKSLINGQLECVFANGATFSLPGRVLAGAEYSKLKLGIRPEHIEIVANGSGIAVTVDLFEHLGDAMILYLKMAGSEQLIAVKVKDEQGRFVHGQRLDILPAAQNCLLFDQSGKALPLIHDSCGSHTTTASGLAGSIGGTARI